MASSIKICHEAIKEKYPEKEITAIFQPHQINRILRERNDFSDALKLFDNIYIYDIYAARENLQEQLQNFKSNKTENISTLVEL
jgi:UDP-N-acetylmuramate-alanine ligase